MDSDGEIQVKHIMDFQNYPQPEKELVKWFMHEILKYKLTIGWYSKGVRIQKDDGTYEGKDSDLKVLDSVCKFYKISSVIKFDRRGVPYVSGFQHRWTKISSYRYYHIDLYQIYKKPLVKSIIYRNLYKDLSLDTVCRAILGEGKYKNFDGLQIQKLSKEKQLEYVAQDSRLVMKLSKYKNYEILDLMNAISLVTNVPFERVCHTQISTWWKKIIEDKLKRGGCKPPNTQVKKRKYIGGKVIEPIVGFYSRQSVHVLDVKSLYPSMMIAHNISFETVNCDCCKGDPHAKVGDEIMSLINSDLPQGEKRGDYWICTNPNYKGIVTRLLRDFRDERFRQQHLQNEAVQLALKNIINGCYGLFGSKFFEYSDHRVAELTTAYGRLVLHHMQHIAKEVYGFTIIYGDTDSIFVTDVKKENDILKFITECSILYDIEIEESRVFNKFLITKKKHYIGIHQDDKNEPEIKGMEGIKSDRPLWINKIEKQFATDIKNGYDPTINVRREYETMESGQVPLDELMVKTTLKKDPSEYSQNSLQRVVGTELGAKQDDVIRYYKSNKRGGGTSNIDLLSRKKYLEMLRTALEESLRLMGYDFMKDIIGYRRLSDFN